MSSTAAATIPLAHLAADPENPRMIGDEALAGLEVSVADYGDLSGIVFNEQTQQLVTGHQRLTTLKRAGATAVQVTAEGRWYVEHPASGERFYVRMVDWEPTKQRIANLVANSPHIAGEFTAAAIEQLRALEDEANFEALRLDELLKGIVVDEPEQPKDGNTDPDAVPEPPAEPVTKPGDLWILGDHRLLCGDSTKAEDVARLLQGERPDLGLHDPPYGIGIQKNNGRIGDAKPFGHVGNGKPSIAAKAYPVIAGDDRPFDPSHLLNGATVVVLWGANHYADKLPASAAWIVWDKRDGLAPNDFSDAELAWVSKGGAVRTFRFLFSGVVRAGREEDGPVRVHPTQKPIALYRWVIEEKTEKGALVYDAYAGSGPTVLACEKLSRRARVMELSPAYCDVIVARWEAFTGRKGVCHHAGDTPF